MIGKHPKMGAFVGKLSPSPFECCDKLNVFARALCYGLLCDHDEAHWIGSDGIHFLLLIKK